jgi:alpha-1,3/alpha-1,6-mannosyltransferase
MADLLPGHDGSFVFLSINRFERKKNLGLAIQALHELKGVLETQNQSKLWEKVHFADTFLAVTHPFSKAHLVMAGGYDPRVAENVEHFQELSELVRSLGLEQHVTFLRSFRCRGFDWF